MSFCLCIMWWFDDVWCVVTWSGKCWGKMTLEKVWYFFRSTSYHPCLSCQGTRCLSHFVEEKQSSPSWLGAMGGEQLTIGITSMIPVGKEASLSTWAGKSGGKDMERYSFMIHGWKTGKQQHLQSTVYLLLTLHMTVLPVLLWGDLYASFLGLRLMALFCSNDPPCPTASWAQVSSLKEVPMAPKTLEPLPGDSYAWMKVTNDQPRVISKTPVQNDLQEKDSPTKHTFKTMSNIFSAHDSRWKLGNHLLEMYKHEHVISVVEIQLT